jgi:hypothetical protein
MSTLSNVFAKLPNTPDTYIFLFRALRIELVILNETVDSPAENHTVEEPIPGELGNADLAFETQVYQII